MKNFPQSSELFVLHQAQRMFSRRLRFDPSNWYPGLRSYDFYNLSRQLLQLCQQCEIYADHMLVLQRFSWSPQQNEFHSLLIGFRTEWLKDKQRNFPWNTRTPTDLHLLLQRPLEAVITQNISVPCILETFRPWKCAQEMDNPTKSFLFHMGIRLNNTVALIQAVSRESQMECVLCPVPKYYFNSFWAFPCLFFYNVERQRH